MSESKPSVTIVGLGLIGRSIGLALHDAEATGVVVGHDKERQAANEAKSLGAVDRVDWNLISACEQADLVVLATPLDGIAPTLKAIGPQLRRGCVVLDTAALKEPVLAAASEHLPEGVNFVGGDPILGGGAGAAGASANLFRGGIFCIVPAPGVDGDAIRLVSDLVSILGAKPLFLDAVEHDGLVAAVDQLPGFAALAMTETVAGQPPWRELRKVAGVSFEAATRPAGGAPAALAEAYHANRENLIRWLDAFVATARDLRRVLAEEDAGALAERLARADADRQAWLADWHAGTWHEGPRADMPERPGLLEGFFGGLFGRRGEREA